MISGNSDGHDACFGESPHTCFYRTYRLPELILFIRYVAAQANEFDAFTDSQLYESLPYGDRSKAIASYPRYPRRGTANMQVSGK